MCRWIEVEGKGTVDEYDADRQVFGERLCHEVTFC